MWSVAYMGHGLEKIAHLRRVPRTSMLLDEIGPLDAWVAPPRVSAWIFLVFWAELERLALSFVLSLPWMEGEPWSDDDPGATTSVEDEVRVLGARDLGIRADNRFLAVLVIPARSPIFGVDGRGVEEARRRRPN
jgi:hypothetical protein